MIDKLAETHLCPAPGAGFQLSTVLYDGIKNFCNGTVG